MFIQVARDIMSTQTKGCLFCVQIGATAFYLGNKKQGSGARLELLTPVRKFRFSKGSNRP